MFLHLTTFSSKLVLCQLELYEENVCAEFDLTRTPMLSKDRLR